MKVDTKKGLMPVILSENMESLLSKIPIKMPISSLLDTDNSSGGSIYISLNAGFTNTLNKCVNFPSEKYVFVSSKSEFYKIN